MFSERMSFASSIHKDTHPHANVYVKSNLESQRIKMVKLKPIACKHFLPKEVCEPTSLMASLELQSILEVKI